MSALYVDVGQVSKLLDRPIGRRRPTTNRSFAAFVWCYVPLSVLRVLGDHLWQILPLTTATSWAHQGHVPQGSFIVTCVQIPVYHQHVHNQPCSRIAW
jgi:hypothetical protein